jgi:undecaprenyl-diphosphatase
MWYQICLNLGLDLRCRRLLAIENDNMTTWQVIVLGVVQGLTEFLPISSTAHLLLVQEWFGRTREELQNDPLTVVIQLGTLVAVVVYFRRDLLVLAKGFYWELHGNRIGIPLCPEGKLAKQVILATIPAIVIGGLFSSKLKEYFYNPQSIAIVSIAFALLMLFAEWWRSRQILTGQPERSEWTLSWIDVLIIGMFQAFALMPGGSRSGTTLTACLLLGMARPAAAKFSFFLSVPAIGAAGAKDILSWYIKVKDDPYLASTASDQALAMLLGIVVSGIVGYCSIAFLMNFLRKYSTSVFVVYRVLLGIVILSLVAKGIIQ